MNNAPNHLDPDMRNTHHNDAESAEDSEDVQSPIARRVNAIIGFTMSACNIDKLTDAISGGRDQLQKIQMQLRFHLAKVDAGLADVTDGKFISAARDLENNVIKARGRRNPNHSIESMLPQA